MSFKRPTRKRRPPVARSAATGLPYQAVLAAALDPIITIDSAGVIQSASDAAERVFGWAPTDLVGQNVSTLMPEPHRSAHDGYLATYHTTGRTEHLNRARRFEAVHKDGTLFPVEVSVSRVDVPGEMGPLFVGIIRDLREHVEAVPGSEKGGFRPEGVLPKSEDNNRLHKLVAEQTAALQSAHLRLRMADRLASIGALAAGLGHDMNNVLLPVRAHLEAARTMTMKPGVRGHIDAVHKSVTYLQQLADALHFLALDADGDDTEQSATDLHAWWSQVGPLLTKAVPKHVKVTVSMPTSLPRVGISAHGLTQAVLNLVVNAGEAICPPSADRKRPDGHVRVWAEPTKAGAHVRLGVTDNGQGMTAEVQRNAFEMFYTTKSRGLGTGLGLPLVARVVTRAGGSVQIESKPGKGTTVAILLPAAGTRRHATQPPESRCALITLTDGRAESMIRHLLEIAGVRVVPGCNPADADIWVLEPTPGALAGAKVWRTRHPHGGLVLFGKPGSVAARRWRVLHPVTIEDRDDLDAIGTALRRAIVGL